MKTLTLLRHAKAQSIDDAMSDQFRVLAARGVADADTLADYLKDKAFRVDTMLASPADRAMQTASIIAAGIDYPVDDIDVIPALYLASAFDLLTLMQTVDDAHSRLLVVGHNPGLSELADLLADEAAKRLPTCGIVQLQFPCTSWRSLEWGQGKVTGYMTPKSLAARESTR